MTPSETIRSHIRTVPDWPAPGVQFRDITPLLSNPRVFRVLIDQFVHRYFDTRPSAIAGLDARGFIIGVGAGLRAERRLRADPQEGQAALHHGAGKLRARVRLGRVEMHTDAVHDGDRVVLIDDLIATGGTMLAGHALLQRLGAQVIEGAAIVDLPELNGSTRLRAAGLPLFTLVDFARPLSRHGPLHASLADAKAAEDLAQQVVGAELAGDLAQRVVRQAQFLGQQFQRARRARRPAPARAAGAAPCAAAPAHGARAR